MISGSCPSPAARSIISVWHKGLPKKSGAGTLTPEAITIHLPGCERANRYFFVRGLPGPLETCNTTPACGVTYVLIPGVASRT